MSTLGDAASEIALALRQLQVPVATIEGRTELLEALGWTLPPGVNDVAIGALNVSDVLDKYDTLNRSSDADKKNTLKMLARAGDLAFAIGEFVKSVATLTAQVFNGLPAQWLATTNIQAEFPKRLLDLLVLRYVEDTSQPLFHLLKLAGIFVVTNVEADPALFRSEHRHMELVLDRAGAIVSPSRSWAEEAYGWGTASYDAVSLVANLRDMFVALGGHANLGNLSRAMEEAVEGRAVPEADTDPMPVAGAQLFRSVLPDTALGGVAVFGVRPSATGGSDGGLGFMPFLIGTAEIAFPLFLSSEDSWDLVFKFEGGSVAGGLVAFVRAGAPVEMRQNFFDQSGRGPLQSGRIGAGVRFRPASGKVNLLEIGDDSGLSVSEVELLIGGRAGSSGTEAFGEITLTGGVLTIGLGSADGFLTSLFGEKPLEIKFDIGVEYSQQGGLRFKGGAVLEATLALALDLGIIVIQNIYLRLALGGSGLELETSASVLGKFGPVTALVERVGIETDLKFQNGNVGPADLSLAFKPPNGVGIVVDAGAVRGGGFLYFDFDAGRYSGAIELSVFSVAVKAFGLIETKLPDGTPGFSFVIVIIAEFTPIQLGFGFTLLGVGGLVGVNRSINEQALGDGVRTGSLEHLLFPQNVVQDAPAIINDLATVFPAAKGHFIVGPMAKLGWGTPTLISAEVGIILEFPGPRLALLGLVRMVLPSADAAILRLQMAIAGLLDFPAKKVSVDASLFDSTVAGFLVTADMAYRMQFGNSASFLLSVGGFNPGFQPPPPFPTLRRASVDFGINGNPSLVASGYFALTSNTAQIGASIQLHASGFGIHLDGWLGFDVLFVFSPFSFTASISAGVRVSFHGVGFGVTLHGSLSGPSPWHLNGKVCVSVLWWDACLPVDVTFGNNQPASLPEIDPWTGDNDIPVIGLAAAISDPRNWAGSALPSEFTVVTLADASTAERTPIDPLGAATLRQKVAPLNRKLEKFGQYKPKGHNQFSLGPGMGTVSIPNPVDPGAPDAIAEIEVVEDDFVPDHFMNLTNEQKLSLPSYEPMDAGISVAPNRTRLGSNESRVLDYVTKYIDADGTLHDNQPLHRLTQAQLDGLLTRSAAALGGIRQAGAEKYILAGRPKKIQLGPRAFVVADACTLVRNSAITGTEISQSQAVLALNQHVQLNPQDSGRFAVIPVYAERAA